MGTPLSGCRPAGSGVLLSRLLAVRLHAHRLDQCTLTTWYSETASGVGSASHLALDVRHSQMLLSGPLPKEVLRRNLAAL